jgi:hypothetical protein
MEVAVVPLKALLELNTKVKESRINEEEQAVVERHL